MNSFIFEILFPLSIAGSILTILILLLRPLHKRISGRLQKAIVLAEAILFIVPVGLIFQTLSENISLQPKSYSQADAVTDSGEEQQITIDPQAEEQQNAQPAAATGEAAQTLEEVVQQTPIVAPVYNAGQEIGNVMPASETAVTTVAGFSLPVLIYFAGAMIFVVVNIIRNTVFHGKLRRSGRKINDEHKIDIYKSVGSELKIKRLPRLMQSNRISAPFITGILRPTLYLPAAEINDTKFAFAVRHELIHYKHADLFIKMVLLFVSSVHWFNPFAHILRYEYAQICETHCDEALIRSLPEQERMHYASALMQFATTRYPYAVAGMATPKAKLKARIAKVIRPTKSIWYRTGVVLIVYVLLMSTGMLVACGVSSPSNKEIEDSTSVFSVLTGEEVDSGDIGKRPFSVSIGNIYRPDDLGAWPQYGIASCDILIELPTESGITRLNAIYSDIPQDEGLIGPVRQMPDPFVEATFCIDPIYVHLSAFIPVWSSGFFEDNKKTVDGTYIPEAFYINRDRIAEGYASENTTFTTGTLLHEAVSRYNILEFSDREIAPYLNFARPGDTVELIGGQANRIQFLFSANKDYDGDFRYDTATGKYLKFQHDQAHMDAGVNRQLAFTNVIVMAARILKMDFDGNVYDSAFDGESFPWYDISYGGAAYYFSGGMYEEAKWSKESDYASNFIFTKADGSELEFNAGNTMICFVDMNNSVSISA